MKKFEETTETEKDEYISNAIVCLDDVEKEECSWCVASIDHIIRKIETIERIVEVDISSLSEDTSIDCVKRAMVNIDELLNNLKESVTATYEYAKKREE